MVTPNEEDWSRESNFLSEKVGHCLNTVFTPVHEVPQEEEVTREKRDSQWPKLLLKAADVLEVAVHVT